MQPSERRGRRLRALPGVRNGEMRFGGCPQEQEVWRAGHRAVTGGERCGPCRETGVEPRS